MKFYSLTRLPRAHALFIIFIILLTTLLNLSFPQTISATFVSSSNFTDPLSVIPGDMDYVFIGDFSKNPVLQKPLNYNPTDTDEDEFFRRLFKTEIVITGTAKDIQNDLPFSYFTAKTTRPLFEASLEFMRKDGEDLAMRNDPYTYYCNQWNECYSYLGGYFYDTSNEELMRTLLSNYYKKSRSTLSQNPEFLAARATAFSEGELFFYATNKFVDELSSGGTAGYDEAFGQMNDFINSLKFVSVSIALHDQKLKVRVFEQLDKSVFKTLGIALKDYMFTPHLYTFFDPSTLLMFTENHNLAGKIKLIEERLPSDIEIPPAGQPYLALGKKLGKGYALGISKNPEGGVVPAFHFIAEVKPNDERAIRTLLDEIFTLAKAALDEERSEDDSMVASPLTSPRKPSARAVLQYSFVANPDDTYTFSMTVAEEELKTMFGTIFNFNFGLDNGYFFFSTLTDEASAKKYAYSDKLKRLFGSSPAMQGLFYFDFKNVSSIVRDILTAFGEEFPFTQIVDDKVFANTFGLLDSLTVKSFSTDDSVTADFILTLQEDATFAGLTDTIISFAQTSAEEIWPEDFDEEELYEHDSYYNSPYARDLQRIADLGDISVALELYYQDTGGQYPLEEPGNTLPDDLLLYFTSDEIPSDPLRERTVFDGGVGGEYWYKACDSGKGYLLLANPEDSKTAEGYYDISKEPLANDCETLTSIPKSVGGENTKYGIFRSFGR